MRTVNSPTRTPAYRGRASKVMVAATCRPVFIQNESHGFMEFPSDRDSCVYSKGDREGEGGRNEFNFLPAARSRKGAQRAPPGFPGLPAGVYPFTYIQPPAPVKQMYAPRRHVDAPAVPC